MHINYLSDDSLIIYLNKDRIKDIDFHNEKEIEIYFRKLFITLKEKYNINVCGYYDITLYKDKYYGIILEISKDDIDYMDVFDNQVEMNIKIKDDIFLYQIYDYFFLNNYVNVALYKYQNKIYLKLNNNISKKDYLTLIENSAIIYGSLVNKILNSGVRINKK